MGKMQTHQCQTATIWQFGAKNWGFHHPPIINQVRNKNPGMLLSKQLKHIFRRLINLSFPYFPSEDKSSLSRTYFQTVDCVFYNTKFGTMECQIG